MPLYRFMLAYAANNSFIGLTVMFCFSAFAPRYFSYFFSIYSRIYRCFMFNYLITTFYFVGKTLDIIILCERLSNFHPRLKRHMNSANFARISSTLPIIYMFCVGLNVPFYFRRSVKPDDHLLDELDAFNTTRTIYYCDQSPLITTTAGWIVLLLSGFIRDFFTLFVEAVLSVRLVVSFRRFMASKLQAHNVTTNLHGINNNISGPCTTNTSFRFVKFKKTTRIIMLFSIASVAINMAISLLYLVLMVVFSNTVALQISALVICMLIIKQFLTFYVFYKLDNNITDVFIICRAAPITT